MAKPSAGLLPFRRFMDRWEVMLVHPGGPFWQKKDLGAWSIAKGEIAENENPFSAAQREFTEETGFVPTGGFTSLGDVRPYRGKIIFAWALHQDFEAKQAKSNSFKLEWPPHSGRFSDFPEVDRVEWFSLELAAQKITKGQLELLQRLTLIFLSLE